MNHFVDSYLLFQLAVVSHTFSTEFYRQLKRYGLTPPKWRILLNLVDGPGMHVNELVAYTLLEQSHVTKLIDQLCQEKLTVRKPSETDRRKVRVQITERGRAMMRPLIEAAKIHEAKVLRELPPGDARRLKSILASLVDRHFKSPDRGIDEGATGRRS